MAQMWHRVGRRRAARLGIEGVHRALHEHRCQHKVLEALDAPHGARLVIALERLKLHSRPGVTHLVDAICKAQRLCHRSFSYITKAHACLHAKPVHLGSLFARKRETNRKYAVTLQRRTFKNKSQITDCNAHKQVARLMKKET